MYSITSYIISILSDTTELYYNDAIYIHGQPGFYFPIIRSYQLVLNGVYSYLLYRVVTTALQMNKNQDTTRKYQACYTNQGTFQVQRCRQ